MKTIVIPIALFCLFTNAFLSAQNLSPQFWLQKSKQALEAAEFIQCAALADSAVALLIDDPTISGKSLRAEARIVQGRAQYWSHKYVEASLHLAEGYSLAVQTHGPKAPLTLLAQVYAAWNDYYALNIDVAMARADAVIALEGQIPPCEAIAFAHELKGMALGDRHLLHQSLPHFLKGKAIRETLAATDSLQLHNSYKWLSIVYRELGAYTESLDYAATALSILEKYGGSPIQKSLIYQQMGVVYEYRGEPQRMLDCVLSADSLLRKLSSVNPMLRTQNLSNFARSYAAIGDPKVADSLYLSIIAQLETQNEPETAIELCNILHNYGILLHHWLRLEEAEASLQRAARIGFPLIGTHPNAAYTLTHVYNGLLSLQLDRNEYDLARKSFDTIQNYFAPLLGSRNPALLQIYNNYGLVLFEMKFCREAITLYDSCLQILHATEADAFDTWLSPVEASYVLWNRAEAFGCLFEQTGDSAWLYKSWQDFDRYVQFLDFLRASYRDEGSRIGLADENRVAFEKVLTALFATNGSRRDSAMKAKVFEYVAKSSAMVLLESVNRNGALSEVLPSRWASRERLLRNRVLSVEREILEVQGNPSATKAMVNEVQRKVSQHKLALYRFLDSLKYNYPAYHTQRYQPEVPSIASIQQQILRGESAGFISYFLGTESLFACLVTPDTSLILQLPADSVDIWVSQCNEGMTRQSKSLPVQARLNKAYRYAAHQLYLRLIAPFGALLPRRVVIAPDGALCGLSFDALLSRATSPNDHDFRQLPYLWRNHVVSYTYSAGLLKEMRGKNHLAVPQEEIMVMAPFDASDGVSGSDTLGILPLTGEEARKVAKLYGVVPLLGNQASKDFFVKNAGKYRQLVLITHGGSGMTESDGDAWLALAVENSNPLRYEKLSTREVYLLSLNADLVILSACETGIGKTQVGEGVLSLSRSFAYAGAKCIINTLWPISDVSTEQVMQHFHRYLKSGKPKDEALWMARKMYLEACTTSASAHPRFWAGLAPVGDMRQIGQ